MADPPSDQAGPRDADPPWGGQAAAGSPKGSGSPTRSAAQRSLLLACAMGIASASQRARVESWLQEDPRCRAMMREMRATLERVAAVLPMPVVVEQRERFGAPMLDRFSEIFAWAREQLAGAAGRISGHGPTLEQASAGGAAGLSGATAAKVIAVCLAAGGTAAVCVQSGLIGSEGKAPPAKAAATRPSPTPTVARKADPPVAKAAARPGRATKRSAPKTTPTSHEQPVISPARQGATEFSFEQTEPAAPPQPAPAPATGGDEFTP